LNVINRYGIINDKISSLLNKTNFNCCYV